ncbi:MAG TPA: nitrate- and nitrite sensing domain-containing protein [Trebonia sp.]|jgi:signal transduction histidine kinase|nr:nitrate- and nitrite sensing domain-containing protein [Trebonia sp.]
MAVHSSPRTSSARLTLIGLLLIPLVSLAALWGLTASITLGNVIRDQHNNQLISTIQPSVIALEQSLAAERTLTIAWLDTGRKSAQTRAQLLAARRSTDGYAVAAHSALTSIRGLESTQAPLDQFLSELASLGAIRAAIDSGSQTPVGAFNAYTAINTAESAFYATGTPEGDPTLSVMTQAGVAGDQAEDLTNGAIALVDGAIAVHGQMTQAERVLLAEIVGQQQLKVGETLSLAPPALAAVFENVFGSPSYQDLVATENQILATPAGQPVPIRAAAFQATTKAYQAAAQSSLPLLAAVLTAESARLSDSLLTELFLAGGFGLVAVIVSVLVAVRFGRRLAAELTRLYEAARQMAEEQLPRLVEKLRRGDDVDVQAESPPLPASRITEISSVAQAFSSVQRTAVEAAVGQASLRKGINQVFVSLSLRSQSLLHKQLSLLDDMERATSDPSSLADLFRLDHLTTRMRRHAEGLLILAGSTPGRGWRDPVLVTDALNAAVSEVEEYVRVDVVTDSSHFVAGTAVNDVIHLLAELVENATAFSPPHTRVEVRGNPVGNGFAIEIEDRGLGIPAEELARINDRLASPPDFDLAGTDQLGLFVTARLAARHEIKVTLRQSPFGGTTAIVMLPHSVMAVEHEAGLEYEFSGSQPVGMAELPSVTARGPAGEARRSGGNGHSAPTFGLTGRHRLGSNSQHHEGAFAPAGAVPWPVPPPPALYAADPPRQETMPAQARPPVPARGTPSRTGRPGLPHRVRQASLAPQLRDRSGPGQASRREESEPQVPSPDETAGRIAALQAGWQRGRYDDLDSPGAGHGDWRTDDYEDEL